MINVYPVQSSHNFANDPPIDAAGIHRRWSGLSLEVRTAISQDRPFAVYLDKIIDYMKKNRPSSGESMAIMQSLMRTVPLPPHARSVIGDHVVKPSKYIIYPLLRTNRFGCLGTRETSEKSLLKLQTLRALMNQHSEKARKERGAQVELQPINPPQRIDNSSHTGMVVSNKKSVNNKVVEAYADFTWDDWRDEVRHFVKTHEVERRRHAVGKGRDVIHSSFEEVGGESKAAAWLGKLSVKDFLSIVVVNLKGDIAKSNELAKILEEEFGKKNMLGEYGPDSQALREATEKIVKESIVMGYEGRAIRSDSNAQIAHLNAQVLQGEFEPEIVLQDIALEPDASLGRGVNDRVMPERSAGQGPR